MRRISNLLITLVVMGVLCMAATPVAAETNTTSPVQTAETVQPYNGAIGPDNPLYGFKIALENFDESFTLNPSEKLEKEINRTELRLAELQTALEANQTDSANRTLDLYWQKFNQTQDTLDQMTFNDTYTTTAPGNTTRTRSPNGTGLENALENLNRHQVIFQNLMQEYPNNTGLVRAYNNSLERELRFEEKIQERSWFGQDNGNNERNGTANDTFVPPDWQDKGISNQTANRAGNITGSPDNSGRSGRFGNSTFSQGANQSWQQPDGSGKGNGNAPSTANQTLQDQRKQKTTGAQGQGQQSLDPQGSRQGNSTDNSATDTQKNNGKQDSGSNNAGNGNSRNS